MNDNRKTDSKAKDVASKCSFSTTSAGTIKKRAKICSSSSSSRNFGLKLKPEEQRYEKKVFCGKLKGKEVCDNVELFPKYTLGKGGKCLPKANEKSCMKFFREEFCPKPTSSSSEKSSTCICPSTISISSEKSISQKLDDTKHSPNIEERAPLDGSVWKAPCEASKFDQKIDEYYIGKCTEEQLKRIPPKLPNWRTQFNLTEDPRTTQCLKNPNKRFLKPQKPEDRHKEITEKIKLAENIETPSVSEEDDSLCLQMDLDNPMRLDFQGWDYKQTYKNDEQDFENQAEYLQQKRRVDRRALHKAIGGMIEDEIYNEKITTPRFFDTGLKYDSVGEHDGRSESIITSGLGSDRSMSPRKLAYLFRTQNKPLNMAIADLELQARYGRYDDLYRTKKEKEIAKTAQRNELEKLAEEQLGFNIADQDYADLMEEKKAEIKAKLKSLPEIRRQKRYPHTLRESHQLRHKMKKEKRVLRDKAIIKKEFYKELGKDKKIKEAMLEISDSSLSLPSQSEESTNDEDGISVGLKTPGKYFLRGFHFLLGSEPRGKLNTAQKRKTKRAVRTAITRTEWFDSLAPNTTKAAFYQYNPPTILKNQSPNDPKLELFPPQFPEKVSFNESPIKAFINEPLGQHYTKYGRKHLKVKKPKYIKVKKFNLTGYLFGEGPGKKHTVDSLTSIVLGKAFGHLDDYLRSKKKITRMEKMKKRRQRMRYLGIPVKTTKEPKKKTVICEESDTENSDWIPEQEQITALDVSSDVTNERSGNARILTGPVLDCQNLPAPECREPTLKHHPRKRRAKPGPTTSRDEIYFSYDVPRIQEPPDDIIVPSNLHERKTMYTKIFEFRHHHDHIDPTQHKEIEVKYRQKVPEITTTDEHKPVKRRKQRPFEKALPQGPHPGEFIDHSVPKVQYNPEMLSNLSTKTKLSPELPCDKGYKGREIISAPDRVYRSGKKKQQDHPLVHKFSETIKSMAKEIKKNLENVEDVGDNFAIDKDAYLKELEDELKSIASCVTSLESSICTNFTNDSGSFLMVSIS